MIGVQIGTTSLDAVNASIQPSEQPKVFDDSNAVVTAVKQGQVDAVVVDLPTALFLTAVELPNATVIGQFEDSIEKMVALAVLMPIVASMGGNDS